MSLVRCQINLIVVNLHLQKIQLTKSDKKMTRRSSSQLVLTHKRAFWWSWNFIILEKIISYLFIRQNGDSGKKYDNIINKAGRTADTKMKPRKSKAADKACSVEVVSWNIYFRLLRRNNFLTNIWRNNWQSILTW